MTDWRALCAELLGALEDEGHAYWPGGPDGVPLIEQARAALAHSEPVLQPIALTEKEPEYDSFCWFGHWTGNCWIWQWGAGPHHWQTHWLPANALPLPY